MELWKLLAFLPHCLFLVEASANILKYDSPLALGTHFQRIIVDADSQDVFVAGRNTLYKLDENLNVLGMHRTGPFMDSINCNPADTENDCVNEILTDNDAKVLQIHPSSHHLLFCGSLKQGICSMYSMRSFNRTQELSLENGVNYAGGRAEVASFFGHWGLHTGDTDTLWLANTYDGRPLPLSLNALSAKRINHFPDGSFDMSYAYQDEDAGVKTAIDIHETWRSDYIIKYIYGFEHDGFAYFLTIQRESTEKEFNYHTKLVRVCQNDTAFRSYTELELACRKKNGITTFYNIAQAASLSPIGDDMASKFALKVNEDALYVILGKSVGFSPDADPAYGSGMCVYTMSQIKQAFMQAQKDCYLGSGRLIKWIIPAEPKCNAYVSNHFEFLMSACFQS